MKRIFTQQFVLACCFISLSFFNSFAVEAKSIDKIDFISSFTTSSIFMVKSNEKSVSYVSTNADSLKVFQLCFNLPGLQSFLEKNADASFKQLNVIIHSVPFANDGSVLHNGNPILQVTKSDIKNNNINAYFYFHEMKIDGNNAIVEYVYNYDLTSNNPKMEVIHLELQKTGANWTITNTKMEAK